MLGLSWGVLVTLVLGEEVAQAELAVEPTGRGCSRRHSAKFSLVYKGLERVLSYLVGRVHDPPA